MAMNLCRNIRCYANKLSLPAKTSSAEISPWRARSYSSGAGYSVPEPLSFTEVFYGGLILAWTGFHFDWFGRSSIEAYLANDRRTCLRFAENNLERTERKLGAIKAKLHERARQRPTG